VRRFLIEPASCVAANSSPKPAARPSRLHVIAVSAVSVGQAAATVGPSTSLEAPTVTMTKLMKTSDRNTMNAAVNCSATIRDMGST
jgi:hypothetical protein